MFYNEENLLSCDRAGEQTGHRAGAGQLAQVLREVFDIAFGMLDFDLAALRSHFDSLE